ncbi:MAG: hypothetical protein K2W85_15970 [Phycisphaerales bacterium]|nr:hypothetical protein [Phycisphaerales bacterium]
MSYSVIPKNWHPVFGDFVFEPGLIRFNGRELPVQEPTETETGPKPMVGLAMCELFFGGGKISMTVESEHTDYIPAVQAVLFRDPATDARLSAGFNSQETNYNFTLNEFLLHPREGARQGWNMLAGTGTLVREAGRAYKLVIQQHASNVEISVDGVIMLRHRLGSSLPPTQCGLFCQSKSEVRVRDYQVEAAKRKVFVVMQFSSPFNELYAEVIKPVASGFGLTVERADEVAGPGVIIADIVRKLVEADIVVTDLTPQNENVFYELGFAHGIGKPTILIADRGKKLPFDVSPFRTLFYDNTIAGKSQVEEGLKKHLAAILNPQG